MKKYILFLLLFSLVGFGQSDSLPKIKKPPFQLINIYIHQFGIHTGIYQSQGLDPQIPLEFHYRRLAPRYILWTEFSIQNIWEGYLIHSTQSVYGRGQQWHASAMVNYPLKGRQLSEVTFEFIPDDIMGTRRIPIEQSNKIAYNVDFGLKAGTYFYPLGDREITATDLMGNTYTVGKWPFGHNDQSTFRDYGFIEAGFSYTKLKGANIPSSNYGITISNAGYNIYLHGLIAAYSRFDDVFADLDYDFILNATPYDPNTVPTYPIHMRLDLNQQADLSPFGFNLGLEMITAFSTLNTSFSGEAGIRPGLKDDLGNRFYIELKMGIVLAKYK